MDTVKAWWAKSDPALDKAGTCIVYIQLQPHSFPYLTLCLAPAAATSHHGSPAQPSLESACQRGLWGWGRKAQLQQPMMLAAGRMDVVLSGLGAWAAHVSLLLQGFFKCLQNLKARTIQQRPILQYINQILLSWLMASGFCCWNCFEFFFFYCNTAGPYATKIDNGWYLGSPEVRHKTHWLHWSHAFIDCITVFRISHMEEI